MNQKYRVISKIFSSVICFAVCAAATIALSGDASAEGGINGNEARVIAVARGSFEYNGETYVARQSYVDQLIAKLSQDDVDLTSEQADAAISAIYSNVETGVVSGYIVKVGSEEDDQKKDNDENKSDDSSDKANKDSDKEPGEKNETDATDAPAVNKNDDGSLTVEDDDGNVVLKLDGILKNTGFSFQDTIVLLILLGVIISCVLIYSVKVIWDTGRQ